MKKNHRSSVWYVVAFAIGWLAAHYTYKQADVQNPEVFTKQRLVQQIYHEPCLKSHCNEDCIYVPPPCHEKESFARGYEQGYRDGRSVKP